MVMPISVSLKLMAFIDGDSSPLALAVRICRGCSMAIELLWYETEWTWLGLGEKGRVGANNIIMQYVET